MAKPNSATYDTVQIDWLKIEKATHAHQISVSLNTLVKA